MRRADRLRALLPWPVRRFPPDLAAVVALVVATGLAAFVPGVRESVLRVTLGVLFVLVAPGYALTAALFPESAEPASLDERPAWDALSRPRDGISTFERALFSVALSALVVPVVGLVLDFTPWGIRFSSLVVAIGGLTLALVAVAAVRRWRVPADERFRPLARCRSPSAKRLRLSPEGWRDSVQPVLLDPASRVDAALNVILVLAVLVALGGGAYAVLGPQPDQSFTEFSLLAENETGALVADDYPAALEAGENETVVVAITNHEDRRVTYSVLVRLQRVQVRENTTSVTETRRIDEFRADVGVGETVHRRQALTPELTGERLRLQFLLYVDEPPADPTAENAYRSVHLWVNATDS